MLLLALVALVPLAGAQTNAPSTGTNAFYAGYTLAQPDASEAVAALREMVGDRGRLVYYEPTGRLLVNGSPDVHQAVQTVLRELSAPRSNVRIEVSFNEQSRDSRTGASVSGGAGPSGAWHVRPRVESRTTTGSDQKRQILLVRSGGEASLAVGQEVPFVTELVRWGRDWGYLDQAVEMRNVGASLWVKARVIGEGPLVEVTLTPEISGLLGGRLQRVRYKRVATSVTVADGASTTLAGYGENAEFYRRFLAGLSQSHHTSDTQITLHVAIEPPAKPQ